VKFASTYVATIHYHLTQKVSHQATIHRIICSKLPAEYDPNVCPAHQINPAHVNHKNERLNKNIFPKTEKYHQHHWFLFALNKYRYKKKKHFSGLPDIQSTFTISSLTTVCEPVPQFNSGHQLLFRIIQFILENQIWEIKSYMQIHWDNKKSGMSSARRKNYRASICR